MLILPYGHDQTVYGRQWVMTALIALNVVVFGVMFLLTARATTELQRAGEALDEIHASFPDARVRTKALDAFPPQVRPDLEELTSDDPDDTSGPGSAALSRAMKRFAAAMDGMPSTRFGYRPGKPSALGFVTSLFMHADLEHLAGNMLFLWLVGAVIECFWEAIPFAILYFAAGFAGNLAHHLASPESFVPLVGASGAIAGLMGAFLVGHPRTRIKVLYGAWLGRPMGGTTTVPARILIPAWIAIQIGFAIFTKGGGVAYWAHVGGFAVGIVGAVIMRWGGWVSYDADQILGKSR